MQLRLRMQKSTLISSKWLEPAVSVEVRRLRVLRESKRTRECRGPKFPSDRKAARHCNHFVVIASPAPLHARANHRADRRLLILSDKPLHTQERVRSFGDRNKMCI